MDTLGTSRVIVGVSATLAGYQALRYAAAHAAMHDVPMVAVRAYQTPGPGNGPQWRDMLAALAREELITAFVDALGGIPTHIHVDRVAVDGVPGPTLVAIASQPTDLLVIGGSQPGRLSPYRRAAVARHCSRHAMCPVVIVPPPAILRGKSEDQLARAVARDAEQLLRHA